MKGKNYMKKKYQKPAIVIEDFVANAAIAASGCAAVVTYLEPGGSCTSKSPFIQDAFDMGYFAETSVCGDWTLTEDRYDGLCIHGPSDNAIIGS